MQQLPVLVYNRSALPCLPPSSPGIIEVFWFIHQPPHIVSAALVVADASLIPTSAGNRLLRETARAGFALISLAVGYREFNSIFENYHFTGKERLGDSADIAVFPGLARLVASGRCCLRSVLPHNSRRPQFQIGLPLVDHLWAARVSFVFG